MATQEEQKFAVLTRHLFGVPIVVCEWPDSEVLNARLKAAIVQLRENSPGTVKTNRRGWQSNSDLHESEDPAIREFVRRIHHGMESMIRMLVEPAEKCHLEGWKIQACWANVNPPGGYNRSHHHDGEYSQFSGFYYVDIGDDLGDARNRGVTCLEDRSGVARYTQRGSDLREREFQIQPRPGVMAIFPATQYHYVKPYSGIGNRISIAFNLHHPDFRVLYYEGMQEPSWWWRNFRGFAILPSKVPEKIHGLSLLCGLLLQERRPRGAGWREHLSVLMDRAFAEASARQEHARAAAAEQYPQA